MPLRAADRASTTSKNREMTSVSIASTARPSDPFVAQLADLCRTERTRAKWVFVPVHAIGLTLGDRLAREGTDWANLRFVTPLDLAIRMAAPLLLERGIDPSEDALGPALVMRLLLDRPEEGGYFRRMAAHPSMSGALWRTFRELRFAGLRATDLSPGAFASAKKHRELVALLAAYEHHLENNGLADRPVVFEEAVRHLDWCPIDAHDLLVELPDTVWPPRVRRFLDALPGQRVRARALATRGVALPARAERLAAPVERVDAETATDVGRLRFLQVPAEAGPARRDGTIEIFHAGGRDAEVDEVFRRVLASGLPLDQVEIACASDAYALLAWEKASRLAWPITLAAGVPAAITRPGRLLLRFCGWLTSDLAAADLRRLLQSGDCTPAAFEGSPNAEDAQISAGQAARLLLKAQATWGRDTHSRALTRLSEEYERRSKDEEASDEERQWSRRKAAQTRTLGAWVEDVLATVPARDAAGHVSLESLVSAAVTFLETNAARTSALDAMALVALTDALGELKALGDYRCDIGPGLEFLKGCVEALTVGRDRPRPGHLHVSTLAEAGFDGRARVFVVGLQEGGVFPAAIEDPVLLDEERARLGSQLRTSGDRLDEAVFRVLSRLAAIGVSSSAVCLSFSCRDTREFRETFPSWMLLQAYRLQQGDASLTYEHLCNSLGEPASAVPPDPNLATTDAGWWLATCTSNGAARAGVLRAFPSLALGVRAEAARDSDLFTEFDGHVAVAGPVLDPSRTGRIVSATTLEDAAKCPFRFFLRQGLGVRPIEEVAADADAWLSSLTKGSELHALFARVLRFAREQKRAPDLEKDLPRLLTWGDARLTELRAEMPPPSDEVYARERREFLDDLDAFLRAECEGRHGRDPVGVEVSFGFPLGEGDDEPLDSAEPLVIDLGGARRLRVHGRIDRINRVAPGKYEVIDYKTGGYWAGAWDGVFAGGTRLQHSVYGRAAEGLLAAHRKTGHVVRGVYVFPAVKGHRRRKAIDAPTTSTLNGVLRQLLDVIGTGVFVIAEEKHGCRFCEFAGACHAGDPEGPNDEEETRAAKKVENPTNTMLDVFRELRGHE